MKASEGGDRSVSAKTKTKKPASRKKAAPHSRRQKPESVEVGDKRKDTVEEENKDEEPSRKKAKTEDEVEVVGEADERPEGEELGIQSIQAGHMYETGASRILMNG